MKKILLFAFLLLLLNKAKAQSTTLAPGTVLPSLTTAQRTALASPVNGTLVFDTDTQTYWYLQQNTWVELVKPAIWQLSGAAGNEITHTNAGGFWSANPTGLISSANDASNPPTAPVEGAGTRLMWIPNRSAFRVGSVSLTNVSRWSAANIGLFSFAAGYDNQASGKYAVATGRGTRAIGEASTAMGLSSEASGSYATALGNGATASGFASVSLGSATTASNFFAVALGGGAIAGGYGSVALGFTANTSNDYAIAIGYEANAGGQFATAIGSSITANADFATILGNKAHANGYSGVMMLGDADPNGEGVTYGGATNQFVARYWNGYYLMTSGNQARTGVQIAHGQSAWSAISDSTRKEKIVLADGESFLFKLRNLRLGSWNYKNQGAKPERFYGPMAQEIFTAFGKDKYGTIGNDTTVSTLNMDGLLFIFSQALEKRTQDLKQENEYLKAAMAQLESRLEAENRQLKAIIQKLDVRLESMETSLRTNSSTKQPLSQTDK
ncbi:tail fiber domain-containing protein [Emticicia agri]|uniref:Peptidase S74 domain-containing protein n=1 Tax=Emticicia agri TaxID=2492393 RepID=A0A4Q5LNU0_9BACT|nr:tail fiber domain-containing protein [Emticicia agri]RYU91038.1 hypothetical protein EWM59_27155 [Emticicia agri]